MKLSPKQASFVAHSDALINIADGAVRSGKTVGNFQAFAEHCIRGPKGDFAVLGKTERTIKRNVVAPMEEMWPGSVKHVQGSGELYLFGRRCWLVGANDAQAEGKVRGSTLAGAYCNELTLFPHSVFQTLIDRCSIPGARIFADCNPDSPFHWANVYYLNADLPKTDLKRWRFQLDDNPTLAEEYKARLKRVHSGVWYKRNILGQWVVAEGAIFDFFDSESSDYVIDILPRHMGRLTVPIDYGTSNATVFLKFGYCEGTWFITDEYYYDARAEGRQKTDAEYADAFVSWLHPDKPQAVVVDPSAASFKVALRKAGVSGVVDADNEVLDGIRTMAQMLSTGRLKIHRSCKKTIEQIATYSWDPKAQQRGEDKPLKHEDHAVDAARYGCMKVARHGTRISSDMAQAGSV